MKVIGILVFSPLNHLRVHWRRALGLTALGFATLLLLIQAVPYGRGHTNPPVRAEPPWNNPDTRALSLKACYNCHSNQTDWRWYGLVAPVSWLEQSDVDGGRQKLNFSEWERTQPWAGQAAQSVRDGNMPPWYYLPLHPEANLSPAQRQALIQGLAATLGEGPRPPKH
jgi:Haem-binding domain